MTFDKFKRGGAIVVEAVREWIRDRCEGLAAALAFNCILGIVPFLAVVLVVSSSVFGERWAQTNLLAVLIAWVGPNGASVLRFMLADVEHLDPATLLTLGAVSALAILWGATGFFLQLQDSLETVWNVRREVARIPVQLKKRLMALIFSAISAIIVLLGFSAAGLVIALRAGPALLPGVPAAEAVVAFLTFWALATFWFKALPPVHLTLRQILPWSALVAAMHLVGRLIVTWSAAGQGEGDGGAAVAQSLILVLLWFHYAGMVFLFGAELMRLNLANQVR